MSDTGVIGVQKQEIETFADSAVNEFKNVDTALETLLGEIKNLDYRGRNAQAFREELNRTATNMSTAIGDSMKRFVKNINAAATAISGSLGGQAVFGRLPESLFTAVAVDSESVDFGRVNTNQLLTVQSFITDQGNQVISAIQRAEASLSSMTPSWMGVSKGRALDVAANLTSEVTSAVRTHTDQINTTIENQRVATIASDSGG